MLPSAALQCGGVRKECVLFRCVYVNCVNANHINQILVGEGYLNYALRDPVCSLIVSMNSA